MDSHVIAIHIGWRELLDRLVELKPNPSLKFVEETLRRPSVSQEKVFQPRSLAMFAQHIRVAKQFSNSLECGQYLMPADKRVQTRSEVGFSRKPSSYAQREAYFGLASH